MAGRIRSIKPEVLDDEVATGLSDAAWRLWVSSWVLADDHGNVRASVKYLAANVWQDTSRDAETPLQELIDKGRFQPYAVNGQRYAHIHAWHKHQRVDNASNPRVPGPEQDDGTWDQTLTRNLAENLREHPTSSEDLREIPLARRARAQSRGETPIPITDHRSPITDPPTAAPAAASLVDSDESTGSLAPEVREVFGYWAVKQSHLTGTTPSNLKLTKDRRGKIEARLREKYTVEDLKLAVDGVFSTAFNVEKRFTDLELICRNASKLDRFIDAGRMLADGGTRTNGVANGTSNGATSAYEIISHLGRRWILDAKGERVPEDPNLVVDGKILRHDEQSGKWILVDAPNGQA
jgi:hypothetical protein